MSFLHSMTMRQFKRPMIGLACVAALVLTGCKSEVYQGLSENQANVMMSVLLKNGIDTEKTASKEGYTLSVDSDKVVQTLELMRENNLPRADYENMGQVFAAKGMISSATEEQARLSYAISQELSETFSQIDGVLTSRVHVVLAQKDLTTGKMTQPSVGVFLRHTPSSQAPHLVSRIRELAANAVPGLQQDKVSVMLVPVRETVTVPMPQEGKLTTSNKSWILYVAGALFALSLGALGVTGSYWMRQRRRKDQVEGSDSSGSTQA